MKLTDILILRLFLLSSLILILNACAVEPVAKVIPNNRDNRIPFTGQLRDDWNFTDIEIKSLQFYVHDSVLLSRQMTEGSKSIVKGKLVLRSGKLIDEIELPSGTPGLAIRVKTDRLYICFEGDCTATLTFGCPDLCGSKYGSLAKWNDGRGKIRYGGEIYWMEPSTYIEIDKNALAKVKRNRRIIKGKRLYEQ